MIVITDPYRLAEPRTRAALEDVVGARNAANDAIVFTNTWGASGAKRWPVTVEGALLALRMVADDRAHDQEMVGIRDFLGGIGLIERFGKSDTLTEAGAALLVKCGA